MPLTITNTASNQDLILNAFVSQIGALGISLNGSLVSVVKRKLPKKDEQLQPPVQIVICSNVTADQLGWMCFGTLQMRYGVMVVIVSPNNNDNVSNLPLYAFWRKQISRLLDGSQSPMLPGVTPPVYDMNYLPGTFLKRGNLSPAYDYQDMNFEVFTTEAP